MTRFLTLTVTARTPVPAAFDLDLAVAVAGIVIERRDNNDNVSFGIDLPTFTLVLLQFLVMYL